MKTHSLNFKNNIKDGGRQIHSKITYGSTILESELYEINFSYDGNLLKSVMKKIVIQSSQTIAINTQVKWKFGVLVNNSYEYLDMGNYIVSKVEKTEDEEKYIITCYDKLLYSMKPYEDMNITYPITIRNYINALATYLGLTFANNNENFGNYNKEILNEKYLDSNGNDLGYTFRDVLDELAEVTGSIICINKDDKLEVRYANNTLDTITGKYLKNVNVKFGKKYRSN